MPGTEALAMLGPPVWILTLTRSKGCPTTTAQKPPIPPDMNDFRAESAVNVLHFLYDLMFRLI